MSEIEARKAFILGQVGDEGIQALRDAGLDVESAVTTILQRQSAAQERLDAIVESGDVASMMTSELVYRSASPGDEFGNEFFNRLRRIALTDEQVGQVYDIEKLILSASGSLEQSRQEPWVRRYFITLDSTLDTMPSKELLTLSELILITDDATSAYSRDHNMLSKDAWAAVCAAAIQSYQTGGAQYATAFKQRVKRLGWSEVQDRAYTRNESLLTERLKWDMHNRPAWTPATCDLGSYKG